MPFDGDLNSFRYPSAAPSAVSSSVSPAVRLWRRILGYLHDPVLPAKVPMHRQIIIEARGLIADENHWTKGNYALTDRNGITRRCAVGALREARVRLGANHQDYGRAYAVMIRLARSCMMVNSVEAYNDRCPHERVLRLFDAAASARAPINLF